MKPKLKKIIGPAVTALIVLAVVVFTTRPDRLIGILVLGLILLAIWGAVEFWRRRKSGRS